MEAPVFDEVGVLPEALPAVGSVEGPLLCVCEMVQEKRGAGGKPLPTLRTPIGPVPSVDPLLADQVARCLEHCPRSLHS